MLFPFFCELKNVDHDKIGTLKNKKEIISSKKVRLIFEIYYGREGQGELNLQAREKSFFDCFQGVPGFFGVSNSVDLGNK